MRIVCKKCSYLFEQIPGSNSSGPAAEAACPRCGSTVDVAAQIAEMSVRTTDAGTGAGHAGPGQGELVHRLLGDYEILDEISRGAMGVVYKARHTKLGRVVALKIMIAGEQASPEQITRFEKEARAAARLRHPNIVPIYEIGVEQGKRFFTMGFIEGAPLDVLIARRELSTRRALEIAADLAEALAYAHSREVIHRDIKPSNIMIDTSGAPQIMDFGLAKQLDTDTKFTRTGTTIGTPSYMAPEQARGENDRIDQRSDVYSLGAVVYEMLTGQPPFTGETMMNIVMKVIHDDPTPLRRINARLHRDIQTIVLKAMEKEPARRYPGMAEFAADIRHYLAGEMISARPAGVLRRAAKTLRKHRAAIIVGLVIAVLASSVSGAIIQVLIERQKQVQLQKELAEREWGLALADQKPEWVVQFRDTFSAPKIGPLWKPLGAEWTVADGRLSVQADKATDVLLDQPFEGNFRIEFTASAETEDARINCFVGGAPRAGYNVRFGNWEGNNLSLLRQGKPLAQVGCAAIKPHAAYRFQIMRRGTLLTCQVTGESQTAELQYEDPELLRYLGQIKFGFDTWSARVFFDDVTISLEEFPGERLNKLQAIDYYILSKGQLDKALAEYKTIVAKQQGSLIAVLAEYNCGLILEVLGQGQQDKLAEVLEYYRNVQKAAGLLTEKHQAVVTSDRERMFFVLIEMGRYSQAADEVAALTDAGRRLDAGIVWQFPALLSRCATDLACDPALKIMEKARFEGAAPLLSDQWQKSGPRVRSNFAKAVTEICRGFADQKKYEEMKRAFLALPDVRASAAFERAVADAVARNDAPTALDLLAFARLHDLGTHRLEQSAGALAQQFIASKQYQRITNVETAYPARSLARYFIAAVSEMVRANELAGATALFGEACRRFPDDKRTFGDTADQLAAACAKGGLYESLRGVYATWGDSRLARRLVEAADAQINAGELDGAWQMIEYVRVNAPDRVGDLARPAADLAARYAAAENFDGLIELAVNYPDAGLPGPFAAAIAAASKAEKRVMAAKLATRALARYSKDPQVVAAVRQAAKALAGAGEAEAVYRMYEGAAKAQGEDKDAAGQILREGGDTLLVEHAYPQAAAAYAAAAQAPLKDSAAAAAALVRAAVIDDHVGEKDAAQGIWTEIPEKYPATTEARIAKLMTGTIDTATFNSWLAENPNALPASHALFYTALRAIANDEHEAARTLLNKVIAMDKSAWFSDIAQIALDRLPRPLPEPQPE